MPVSCMAGGLNKGSVALPGLILKPGNSVTPHMSLMVFGLLFLPFLEHRVSVCEQVSLCSGLLEDAWVYSSLLWGWYPLLLRGYLHS